MLKPDGQIPTYGDTDIEEFRPGAYKWNGFREGEAMSAYKMFGREDCLYIATAGKQGTRPEQVSVAFPQTGHYIMRSDWGGPNGEGFEDARYLFLRGGKFGSHGHWDLNQITLYAYGRPLIIDPGRSNYGTPLMFELTEARSHNVLLVDDLKMQRRSPVLNAWHTTPLMDLADNSYSELYAGVNHRRAVVFVRPDYYVMFDLADSNEPRTMGINFWLTPPELTVDRQAGRAHSNEPNGSNVLLQLADPRGIEIAQRNGTVDYDKKIRDNMPVVTFNQSATTQARWTTVIYPYPQGASVPALSARQGRFGTCVVQTPDGLDAIFCANETESALPGPKGAINGRAGLIRYDRSGAVTSFALLEGTQISSVDCALAVSDRQISQLSVVYGADMVEVTCPDAEPSLKIAAMGRTKAIVNGKTFDISSEMFRAF